MMLKKPTIAILALIIVVVIGAGIYAGTAQIKPNNQSGIINNKVLTTTDNNSSQVNSSQSKSADDNMISASEAQNIAKNYIEEENATAGTPRLVEISGQMIYVVPVIMDGNTVGQIEIDAYTGKNVGGAGGVA